MITLNWTVSASASAMYAARGLGSHRRPLDTTLAKSIDDPAMRLVRALSAGDLSSERFWEHLLPLSTTVDSNIRLAEQTLAKVAGRHQAAALHERIADRIAGLERAFAAAQPELIAELQLRGLPIKEQWQARGPGLLAAIGRLTDPELLPQTASVVLIYPTFGGGGQCFAGYNLVLLEAVLTNPAPELPEVVRLSWLVSQLNLELPKFQGEMNRHRAMRLGGWALIPATLAAAEQVELGVCDLTSLERAITMWDVDAPKSGTFAADLLNWWETYRSERPTWQVAIGALERLIK